MSGIPNSTDHLASHGHRVQIDNASGGQRDQVEVVAVPIPFNNRNRQASLGGSSVEQLTMNSRLPAPQQPHLNPRLPSRDAYNNNQSRLPAQPDAYSVLHDPRRAASIGEYFSHSQSSLDSARAPLNDSTKPSSVDDMRRKAWQQGNSSPFNTASKLPINRGLTASSDKHVEFCVKPDDSRVMIGDGRESRRLALDGVEGAGPVPLISEESSPIQFSVLPARPPQARISRISLASTTMTPAPMPDGGLQRQEPLGPPHAGAFSVLPGIAIQHQQKGALTPHPRRLGSSRTERLSGTGNRHSSKEFTSCAVVSSTTTPISSAEQFHPDDSNDNKVWSPKWKMLLVAVVGVIGISVALGIGITTAKHNGQPSSDTDPLLSNLIFRLQKLSSDPETVFENVESPQARGLMWIYDDVKMNGEGINNGMGTRLESRYVLAVFFYALMGSSWSGKYKFLSHDHHECDWNGEEPKSGGIECNSNGDVTSVVLEDNNLSGSLPEELWALTRLELLTLKDNRLTGEIPGFGELSRLARLTLSGNELENTIPSSIGQLTGLRYLEIDDNRLSGSIPTEIGLLTDLQRLHVEGNLFTGELPASMSNLSMLNSLRFHFNKNIGGPLPADLGSLSRLKYFIGAENSLTGTIPWETFPIESQLVKWNVEENSLGGSLPLDIGSLFPLLESLNVGKNQILGTLPESFGRMNRTKELILRSNLLIGTLPSSVGSMVSLSVLDISDNRLIGSLPTELGMLIELEILDLSHNSLSGTIPSEIGLMSKLTHLLLSGNAFSGDVPVAICRNSNLTLDSDSVKCKLD